MFTLFCLAVPVFMSYNGGATAATVDTIQKEGHWSPAGIGLLGAMDKIGMTMAAAFWGYMLQRVSSKRLLCAGLLVNATSTLIFATLRNPITMCLAKLLIGFTESLQWVWCPLWIGQWAPPASLPIWMNLSGGGVASGVGNGLGTIIAGFTTAQGCSYELAFQIEAGALFALWLALALTDWQKFTIREDRPLEPFVKMKSPKKRVVRLANESLDEHLVAPCDSAGEAEQEVRRSLKAQLRDLWENPLYCYCAMAYASANYVNSALQFLWVRVFGELWSLNKDWCVLSFLVISATSGALGITMASCNRVEHDHAGRLATLRFIHRAFSGAVLGALVAAVGVACGIAPQLHQKQPPSFELKSIIVCWLGCAMVLVGVTAVPGLLQIVCIQSVDQPDLRSFATGLSQGANNLLGFAMGPLLPQLAMDFMEYHLGFNRQRALACALLTALVGTSVGAFCTTLAVASVGLCSASDSDLENATTEGPSTRTTSETDSVSLPGERRDRKSVV